MARQNFNNIRQKLEPSVQADADIAKEKFPKLTHSRFDTNAIVQEVRHKIYPSIIQQCGSMRLLGVSQPVELHDIYTNVNILKQVSSRRRVEIIDLLKVCSDEIDRLGIDRFEQRVPGLEAVKQYSKLMVLGKPGAGKTTFLKHIAIQNILGKFQANLVPIFITLKNFTETNQSLSLLEYITKQFTTCNLTDKRVAEFLLNQGIALVLLDGLDEVMEKDEAITLQEISKFINQYHNNNYVISCRIAARKYIFENFTEVEVADFDNEQITAFATKWFITKDPLKGKKIIQKLREKSQIQELATNPLLLTLLCLTFEESADFPANRSELYQEGINLLLKKWDAICNIERDQAYKNLTVKNKEDLLSKIAQKTFKSGNYFFRQQELEQQIANYIRHLPDASTEGEALQLDACAVIKSIEAQHGLLVERARGIYSFSHLTFQEYFTAREIITNSEPQALEIALKQLASHITEKRWREVLLLTVVMSRNASYLLQLIKQQIDNLIAQNRHLQQILSWISQKSCAVIVNYKVAAVRAFYLDLILGIDLKIDPALSLALKLDPTLSLALKLDLELDLELNFALNLARTLDLNLLPTLDLSLERVLQLEKKRSPLTESLQYLKAQLPNSGEGEASFKKWWKANGKAWTEQLRAMQIKYRNIGHNWQLSLQQKQALQQYYDANKLLVDCLNSPCYITHTVRQQLEETLLLPIAEIEQIETRC